MIDLNWIQKTLGKHKMSFVEDITNNGGVLDIMLIDGYKVANYDETLIVIDYSDGSMNKTAIKEELHWRFSQIELNHELGGGKVFL